MAELRCPNCGENNPDVLDLCQFCQTPLKPESVLRIGETPTKKNTGELESVLPEWLRDVRQQAKDSAEEEAAQAAQPNVEKNEPPDLLAGLASQVGSTDEEEIPDWLASINPTAKPKAATPSASAPAPESDFFAQFNQSESKRESEPAQEDVPSQAGNAVDQPPVSEERDELSEWFSQASEQPEEIVELDPDAQQSDRGWASSFDSPSPSRQEPAPKEEEDLSWLRNLEEASKQTGDLKAPKQNMDWSADSETPSAPSQPSASQEDLSWLDSLGGIEAPSQPALEQPSASSDDLSWLNQFGGTQASQPPGVAEEKPSSEEDLSWLNNSGAAAPEASQPSHIPDADADPVKPFSPDDLSWLNDLGGTSEPSQPVDAAQEIPSTPQADLDWLKDLGGQPEPLSTPPFAESESIETSPRQTAPLGKQEAGEETEPDWLKSAAEAPSMPAPGDVSMDWFTHQDQPVDEKPLPSTPSPNLFSDLLSSPGEASPLSNQDVDSLFSEEMPDWLAHPGPATDEATSGQTAAPLAGSEESLAPVDLPSWVQAMRPVEAVISESASSSEDQPEETEGPLAGLRGVIPSAPVGSSTRPKAVSLKLQVTDEQQASAAILEQILGSETSPRALITSSFIASQQVLRWVLSGLFLLVLGAVIILRAQTMPVSANLPLEGSNASNAAMRIPADAKVLIVIDYEPSLAGEMEALGGPLLDQMVLLSHPNLSFVSTSPNGSALVERLMSNTKINQPAPDGFGYQAGEQYLNLGYLPGGSAGVLGFLEAPGEIIPASDVVLFAEYAAVVVMTDHAESGRVWVEQLQTLRGRQIGPALTDQSLLMIASAQAGPLLQPYVSSQQVTGMISGLSEAARYEFVNNSRPGIARSYWDAFGIGLTMSIALIIVGSLWSVFTGIRARRAEAEQG